MKSGEKTLFWAKAWGGGKENWNGENTLMSVCNDLFPVRLSIYSFQLFFCIFLYQFCYVLSLGFFDPKPFIHHNKSLVNASDRCRNSWRFINYLTFKMLGLRCYIVWKICLCVFFIGIICSPRSEVWFSWQKLETVGVMRHDYQHAWFRWGSDWM